MDPPKSFIKRLEPASVNHPSSKTDENTSPKGQAGMARTMLFQQSPLPSWAANPRPNAVQKMGSPNQISLTMSTHSSTTSLHSLTPQNHGGDHYAYVERCRLLMEHQRQTFSQERKQFEEERDLWSVERAVWARERRSFLSRIADLEFTVRKAGLKVASTSGEETPQEKPRSNFGSMRCTSNPIWKPQSELPASRSSSMQSPTNLAACVPIQDTLFPRATTPTRVFPEESRPTRRFPSIDEIFIRHLSDASGSPGSVIPIEKIDSRLDGINLKPTAIIPSSIDLNLLSESSPGRSPIAEALELMTPTRLQQLTPGRLELPTVPENAEYVTRDAGHTPLIKLAGLAEHVLMQEDEERAPTDNSPEVQFLPENLVSYFPTIREDPADATADCATKDGANEPVDEATDETLGDLDDDGMDETVDGDPELKGPLTLRNNPWKDEIFLNSLDKKLQEAADFQAASPDGDTSSTVVEDERMEKEDEDNEEDHFPKLKFKTSYNFGKPFGHI